MNLPPSILQVPTEIQTQTIQVPIFFFKNYTVTNKNGEKEVRQAAYYHCHTRCPKCGAEGQSPPIPATPCHSCPSGPLDGGPNLTYCAATQETPRPTW